MQKIPEFFFQNILFICNTIINIPLSIREKINEYLKLFSDNRTHYVCFDVCYHNFSSALFFGKFGRQSHFDA